MTDTEINLAIAEACGWTFDGRWWSHPTLPDNGGAEPLPPDFTADLNAMHEAEKTIAAVRVSRYTSELWSAMCRDGKAEEMDIGIIHATARQRAEAFLRTLGKWKD